MSLSMKNQPKKDQLYLLIKLQHIQQRFVKPPDKHQIVFFSFSIGEQQMYFSSCVFPHSPFLSDDILIPTAQNQLPQNIILHRWQNNMIMFSHEIDISELKTRTTTKKKHETKNGQILSFMIIVLNQDELRFGDKYVSSISQHYLIIEQMYIKQNKSQARGDVGPSYFMIQTSGSLFVMPILDGNICIKLPETLEFQYFRNGQSAGKSKLFNSSQLTQKQTEVQLSSEKEGKTNLKMKLKWGINFFQTKIQNSLLLEAHELLLYDFQVKFDSYTEYANAKVKIVYGNKGFQIGSQFNTSKPPKIKKIIYFIIKSQDQEINIVVQKNLKIVAQSKFFTDQIVSYVVHTPKRKLLDENGKVVGNIKFKCEKAKNLSTPLTNKFWKQVSKKKANTNILLSIEQISADYDNDQPLNVVFKTQAEERTINRVPNFSYYDKQTKITYAPLVLTVKNDQSIYVMLKGQQNGKQEQNQNDFIGIAVLNYADFKLGANSVQVQFFKNQGKVASCNCLINKVIPYPFIKSSFQPQILLHSKAHKTVSIQIFLKKVIFTPYFYTYQYDNKNQVYCIVQVNRLKKVLIMESSMHNQLQFITSSSSDSLSFYIEQSQYIKVKATFLISDSGHEQQIYGWALIKLRAEALASSENGLKYNKIELKNDFGTDIGLISLQVHEGPANSFATNNSIIKVKQVYNNKIPNQSIAGPFKSQIRKVKNDLDKVNQNIQIIELSIKKKGKSPPNNVIGRKSEDNKHEYINHKAAPARYNNAVQYNKRRERNHSVAGTNNESIKLPFIKNNNKQKNNLQDLVNMMKIRKRGMKGYVQENSTIVNSFVPKHPASQRAATKEYQHNLSNIDPPFYTQKGSRQNPNIDRSLEIIFPKKVNKKQKQENIKKQISQYQQKLRGLKSALNNIDQNDGMEQQLIQQVSVKKSRASIKKGDGFPLKGTTFSEQMKDNGNAQFQDNQFAQPV